MLAFIDTPPFMPPQASKFAEQYDWLFWYVSGVCAAGGLLVYALLTYFCFRYAKKEGVKPQRILGSNKLEFIWTIIPLFFFLSFFVWGTKVYNTAIKPTPEELPANAPEYFVVGKQWMWKVQHPTGQREINELTIPVNTTVRITGTSEDVIHDFGVPAFRSKFDVVPGRYTSAWYNPTKIGTYHLFCDQYCGQGHSQMVGKVHVVSQADYQEFLYGRMRTKEGKKFVDGSPAWEGAKLFQRLGCLGCHNNESESRAPNLEGIANTYRVVKGGQKVLADRKYIENSIRYPLEHVREGWAPIMPAYTKNLVTQAELIELVAYIMSLKPGDLPSRTEASPPPIGARIEDTQAPQP
jgi:cytochrome c oxidase subunit 2